MWWVGANFPFFLLPRPQLLSSETKFSTLDNGQQVEGHTNSLGAAALGKLNLAMGTHPRLNSGKTGLAQWRGFQELRPKKAWASFLRQQQDPYGVMVEKCAQGGKGLTQLHWLSWPRSSRSITCPYMEADGTPATSQHSCNSGPGQRFNTLSANPRASKKMQRVLSKGAFKVGTRSNCSKTFLGEWQWSSRGEDDDSDQMQFSSCNILALLVCLPPNQVISQGRKWEKTELTEIRFLTPKGWDFIIKITVSFRGKKNEGSCISYSPEFIDLNFPCAKCPAQSMQRMFNKCQFLSLLHSSPRST